MAQVKKGCVQAAGVLVMYVARHRISGERRILAGFDTFLLPYFSSILLSIPSSPDYSSRV